MVIPRRYESYVHNITGIKTVLTSEYEELVDEADLLWEYVDAEGNDVLRESLVRRIKTLRTHLKEKYERASDA